MFIRKVLKYLNLYVLFLFCIGQHLLSGTTLGLELVNDIREQTHVLAEGIKLVANQTDDNSMTIQHFLETFDIYLNDTTAGMLEIKKVSSTVVNLLEASVDLFYHVNLNLVKRDDKTTSYISF